MTFCDSSRLQNARQDCRLVCSDVLTTFVPRAVWCHVSSSSVCAPRGGAARGRCEPKPGARRVRQREAGSRAKHLEHPSPERPSSAPRGHCPRAVPSAQLSSYCALTLVSQEESLSVWALRAPTVMPQLWEVPSKGLQDPVLGTLTAPHGLPPPWASPVTGASQGLFPVLGTSSLVFPLALLKRFQVNHKYLIPHLYTHTYLSKIKTFLFYFF